MSQRPGVCSKTLNKPGAQTEQSELLGPTHWLQYGSQSRKINEKLDPTFAEIFAGFWVFASRAVARAIVIGEVEPAALAIVAEIRTGRVWRVDAVANIFAFCIGRSCALFAIRVALWIINM